MTDDDRSASRVAEDQLERELAEATARRLRRSRWVFRGSVGLVGLAIATWLIGWKLPRWILERAERSSRACFTKIERTGDGDPTSCVPDLWFHGVRSEDRDAASYLERSGAETARELDTQVAIWRKLDASARDVALRARIAHDDWSPTHEARLYGAHEIVLEMAQTSPADADPSDRSDVIFDGLTAAITLGDLDAARALVEPQLAAGETGWSEWIGCVLGLACAPPPSDNPQVLAIDAAARAAAEGKNLDEIVRVLGDHAPFLQDLTSPWSLVVLDHEIDPANMIALADALETATVVPPAPKGRRAAPPHAPSAESVEAALRSAWGLRIDAARIAAVIGDLAMARAALAAADRVAADPRVGEPALSSAALSGLIAAVLPADEALGALDRVPDAPEVRLNRALLLAGAGRDPEALAVLRDVSPFGMCTGEYQNRRGGFFYDEVCDALAWTKLALLLRTSAPLPEPVGEPDDDATEMGALRYGLAMAITGGPEVMRRFRWEERFSLPTLRVGPAAPMVAYVLSRLATEGEDPEVMLSAILNLRSERQHQALLAVAADLRGDKAAADEWRARRARVDAAMARSPEARLIGARSL